MKLLEFINRKVLSIDFGSNEIKIVEGQALSAGLKILRAFTIKLPKDTYYNGYILDPYTISSLVEESLNKNKIKTEFVHGVINSSSIITREISIPKVEEKEVAAVVGFQLDEFFPVSPEDYVVDLMILGTVVEDNIEKFNIQIIGVPKSIVFDHLNLIKDIGLRPKTLDFQGNAIAKLLNYSNKVNLNYNTRDIVYASIDMGYSSTKLTIVRNGRIEITRVLDIGGKVLYDNINSFFNYSIDEIKDMVFDIGDISIHHEEFTEENRLLNIIKTTMTNLFEEIEMIFRYYRTRSIDNDINIILLQGGFSNILGMANLYSNYFDTPTIVLENLDKINWDGNLHQYVNAIGGLIRVDEV